MEQIASARMKSHHIVSKLKLLEKFHDSIRLVNRDDRNGSRAGVKAALTIESGTDIMNHPVLKKTLSSCI